jgi:hypothetical protein
MTGASYRRLPEGNAASTGAALAINDMRRGAHICPPRLRLSRSKLPAPSAKEVGGQRPPPSLEIGGRGLPHPRLALPARPGITERKARCRPSIEFGGSSLVFVALAVGAPHDASNCRGRTTILRRVALFQVLSRPCLPAMC